MWEDNGVCLELSQFCGGKYVLLYRSVRNLRDYAGGHNRFLTAEDLRKLSYTELLRRICGLRKEGGAHERHDNHSGRAA